MVKVKATVIQQKLFPSFTGSPVEIKDINEVEAKAWAL
jgi:hypothetical protein